MVWYNIYCPGIFLFKNRPSQLWFLLISTYYAFNINVLPIIIIILCFNFFSFQRLKKRLYYNVTAVEDYIISILTIFFFFCFVNVRLFILIYYYYFIFNNRIGFLHVWTAVRRLLTRIMCRSYLSVARIGCRFITNERPFVWLSAKR